MAGGPTRLDPTYMWVKVDMILHHTIPYVITGGTDGFGLCRSNKNLVMPLKAKTVTCPGVFPPLRYGVRRVGCRGGMGFQ